MRSARRPREFSTRPSRKIIRGWLNTAAWHAGSLTWTANTIAPLVSQWGSAEVGWGPPGWPDFGEWPPESGGWSDYTYTPGLGWGNGSTWDEEPIDTP
ncbi:hypothetical protein B0H14DRAFT_3539116 [Mycena olivaceomarginata]|nr:hypothetical protein B0H14DRAFT_3539116 [Mycena olivaceomarginata]